LCLFEGCFDFVCLLNQICIVEALSHPRLSCAWLVAVIKREPSFSVLPLTWSVMAYGAKLALFYSADHYNIVDHFYRFVTISSGAKSRCSLMHLVLFDLEGKK